MIRCNKTFLSSVYGASEYYTLQKNMRPCDEYLRFAEVQPVKYI